MKKILMLILATSLISFISAEDLIPPPSIITNKSIINISYQLEKELGEIKQIELWVTDNGGDTWSLAKFDQDLISPVSYTPPKDGLYGFIILQLNEVREKPEEPAKGTQPQWLYTIDRKSPEMTLDYEKNLLFKAFAEVPLKWSLSDTHLGDRPIRQIFSWQ